MNVSEQLQGKQNSTRSFLKDHFGIGVATDEVLQELLKDNSLSTLVQESMTASRQEQTRASYLRRGYDHSDKYWKAQKIKPMNAMNVKKKEKRVSGLAYDAEGRRIPHVELFYDAAEAMQRRNPNIAVRATRHGLERMYKIEQPDYFDGSIKKNRSFKEIKL